MAAQLHDTVSDCLALGRTRSAPLSTPVNKRNLYSNESLTVQHIDSV